PSQTVRPILLAGIAKMHLRFSYRKFNTFPKIHAPEFRLDPICAKCSRKSIAGAANLPRMAVATPAL
ncbi:hypothetical protein, partial [uncultured Duncaniella sp.]|uniref:hypothetical protein n=1 Tax=uncultured Duncaniella sp. TaxID=2768039 RepID=UPI0025A9B762